VPLINVDTAVMEIPCDDSGIVEDISRRLIFLIWQQKSDVDTLQSLGLTI
jgi:hypothetical protein